jgi:hypothetical protein
MRFMAGLNTGIAPEFKRPFREYAGVNKFLAANFNLSPRAVRSLLSLPAICLNNPFTQRRKP